MAKPKINEEKLYDEFHLEIIDAIEKAEPLGTPMIAHAGLRLFTQMALDCAPNEIIGLGVVLDTIRDVKRDDEFESDE
tara:strand:- start:314 stop:547 length:234 start_codon:yes stop_codon:yes gene_type:complete